MGNVVSWTEQSTISWIQRYCLRLFGLYYGSIDFRKDAVGAVLLAWLLFSFFFGSKDFFVDPSAWDSGDKSVGIYKIVPNVNRAVW